jgi:putative effector of murein hydrolase
MSPATAVTAAIAVTVIAWLGACAAPTPSVIISVGVLSMLIVCGLLHMIFHDHSDPNE